MSCSCPRVMSPTPGRSTLITSAPNQASSCVHVGPDCTCVKSRILTPSSALPIWASLVALVWPCGFDAFDLPNQDMLFPPLLFLLEHALRLEVADPAALAAGRRVDHGVDEGRLAGVHGLVHGALQLIRRCRIDANPAEGLDHLVVARALDEHRRRRVRTCFVDVGAAIDAVVIEDDDTDRQLVPADRLDLHAGEAEGAVALDCQHGFAGLDRCG